MARLVHRHWPHLALILCVVVTAAIYLFGPALPPEQAKAQALEPQASVPTESELYEQVRHVRKELNLTNRDLAAMGCDANAAQQVILAVKQWCQANGDELQSNQATINTRQRDAQKAIRLISLGQDTDQAKRSLNSAREQLTSAISARQQLLATAESAGTSSLTASAREVHQSLKTNQNLPERLRYVPGLSADQIKDLRIAEHRVHQGETQRTAERDRVFASSQKQAMQQAQANIARHLSAIAEAEAQVLPMPADYNDNAKPKQRAGAVEPSEFE